VEDLSLDILKDLLSRRGEGFIINNPLKIKVPESELLSDSFNNGDPFPDGFDGTSTTDTYDGLIIPASDFTAGDKVAVQVWFNFNNKSGQGREEDDSSSSRAVWSMAGPMAGPMAVPVAGRTIYPT